MKTSVKDIVREFGKDHGNLIPILQNIQEHYGYLSEDSISEVAEHLGMSQSNVFGVATFYTQFKFIKPGEHIIKICQGTACHVKGSNVLLDILENYLDIKPRETTADGLFTLERVACLGCCALAPVMVVDDEVHGKMTQDKIGQLLDPFKKSSGPEGGSTDA